jgi:excisionase family DNA binding protein
VERGETTLTEAAKMLGLSQMTVLRHIKAGLIPATQYCKGAPWVIKRQDIEDQHLAKRLKAGRADPPSPNPDQQPLIFQ